VGTADHNCRKHEQNGAYSAPRRAVRRVELDSHARLVYTAKVMANHGALILGLIGLLLSGAGEGLGGRR
jgi:hypothetical protein